MTSTPVPPTRRADSLHFFDTETGNAAEYVTDLFPRISTHASPAAVASALAYAAMNVTVAWCWQCHDRGVLAETWGPNEGCREYMTEPEVWYCDCVAGDEAREEDASNRAKMTDQHEYDDLAFCDVSL